MVLIYSRPSANGALRQGEILTGLWEHRAISPAAEISEISFQATPRQLSIVITADCDLHWDWQQRNSSNEESGKDLNGILLLELFPRDRIRDRIKNASEWGAVKSKKRSRFHLLPSAPIGPSTENELFPEAVADFKQVLALSPESLYAAIEQGLISRKCLLPEPYLRDFIHRCFFYLGRVSLPD